MPGPTPAPDDPFAPAAAAGVHRMAIPTPFAVGRVNVYLIEDEPLTLVDAGPNSGTSLDELQQGLARLGHRLEDLELVIVTHQHIDHLGLVSIVASHSGAEVAAIDAAVPFIENYKEEADAQDEFATRIMLRHGIPEDGVCVVKSVRRDSRAWGARGDVTRVLPGGEVLDLRDRSLGVHLRQGHSPTDPIFHDPTSGIVLAADHLIAHISSNPLITRPLDGSSERTQALVAYLRSMRRTRALPAEIVLSGHGEPIVDHVSLIDKRFEKHEQRARRIYELIAERPRTGYEVAQALWGNVAVTQAFLTLSEVIGHVDLLLNAGWVSEVAAGPVVRYEATGRGAGDEGGNRLVDRV